MYRVVVYRVRRSFFGDKHDLVEDVITDNLFMITAVAERYKHDPRFIVTTFDETAYYQ